MKILHKNPYQVKMLNKNEIWTVENIAIQRLRPYYRHVKFLEQYGIEQTEIDE